MTSLSTRRIRLAPESHREFDRGVRAIADAIRPTLGPVPRTVAVSRPVRTLAPAILDDGAAIARRIIALSNIHDDPGAMYVRGMLWRLQEEVGDGTATAAILFASLLAGGRRAIAAGIPAQPLRAQIERLADRVSDAVVAQARTCSGRHDLTRIARAICHDSELANLLGDAMAVVGATGQIDLRPSNRHETWREFVQGSYWESGLLSATTFGDPARQRTELHDAAILITNLAIDDPREIIPVLEALQARNAGGLLVIAQSISPALSGLLHANSDPETFPIVVARTPVRDQRGVIEDLAIMTGGRAYVKEAGDSLRRFVPDDLGMARTVWVTRQQFGLVAGQGDARAVRRQTDLLSRAHRDAGDKEVEAGLLHRLGTFQGTSATLWVGANSDLEAKTRLEVAGRGVGVLRQALRDGVVPGGGSALLHCQASLNERLQATDDEIERAALRIVIAALQAPAETLLTNCGHEAAPVLAAIRRSGGAAGFDAVAGCSGDMHAMGIVDPAGVVATVARTAMQSAALALTIDVVVHTHATDPSVNPE